MPEIKLRSLKGSALTHTEMDENLQNLLNSSSLAGTTSDGSATLTLFSSASVYPTNTYGLGITFPYTGSALITGSLEVKSVNATDDFFLLKTGSLDSVKVNGQGVLQLGGFTFTPTAVRGGVYYNHTEDEFFVGKNN